jgi:hypothetical protein
MEAIMPMHNWKPIEAGIFHHFHQAWIMALSTAINDDLPDDYYALAEQFAGQYGPDVVALTNRKNSGGQSGSITLAERPKPKTSIHIETANQFYRRKQNSIVIKHVSGDEVVAMIELVSPSNKNSNYGVQTFVRKACDLLNNNIHLLIVDPFPPNKHNPQGMHGAIWENYTDSDYVQPATKPLTLASYRSGLSTEAFIEPFAVGDVLMDMPLYLMDDGYIDVPLESTYLEAWSKVPVRWQREIDATPPATPH